jgi:hypothetical protein
VNDLIQKYPDILTMEERDKLSKSRDWVVFGIMMGLGSIPYTMYLAF